MSIYLYFYLILPFVCMHAWSRLLLFLTRYSYVVYSFTLSRCSLSTCIKVLTDWLILLLCFNFQVNKVHQFFRGFLPPSVLTNNHCASTGFCRPDVLLVTQPTESKYWRKLKALTQLRKITHKTHPFRSCRKGHCSYHYHTVHRWPVMDKSQVKSHTN